MHYKDFNFTCSVLLHYLVKFENRKKILPYFLVERYRNLM